MRVGLKGTGAGANANGWRTSEHKAALLLQLLQLVVEHVIFRVRNPRRIRIIICLGISRE